MFAKTVIQYLSSNPLKRYLARENNCQNFWLLSYRSGKPDIRPTVRNLESELGYCFHNVLWHIWHHNIVNTPCQAQSFSTSIAFHINGNFKRYVNDRSTRNNRSSADPHIASLNGLLSIGVERVLRIFQWREQLCRLTKDEETKLTVTVSDPDPGLHKLVMVFTLRKPVPELLWNYAPNISACGFMCFMDLFVSWISYASSNIENRTSDYAVCSDQVEKKVKVDSASSSSQEQTRILWNTNI